VPDMHPVPVRRIPIEIDDLPDDLRAYAKGARGYAILYNNGDKIYSYYDRQWFVLEPIEESA
jgi:hypothetical protein